MLENTVYFCLKNRLSELDILSRKLEAFGNSCRLSRKHLLEINLALEEIFTNIISYGYVDNADHWIKIMFSTQNGHIIIRIEDDGIPFNLVKTEKPDFECGLEERPIGGLGVYLIKQLMNDIVYERDGNKNILTMKKKFTVGR
ncbi:MAG: ATP-binding protein [Desulfobacterales bacterium]|nr:ATP-binding protein [Desulfobacterales bacterium]